jgi:CubicO group peptidase (beta-lactamase class C family)
MMPTIIRNRWYAGLAAAFVAVIVVGRVGAQWQVDGRAEAAGPLLENARINLGPGPLPPRPPGNKRVERSRIATVEEAIDQCVESERVRQEAPGAAVAVILDGELLHENGYGVKIRNDDDPVDAETIFRIGSVTKQMTAAAVMQQVELGRVELDAPVTEYIPDFEVGGRWPADRISVWNTLTHTSCFPDYINEWGQAWGEDALSLWARHQGEIELHAPPGAFWNYSNTNFMIAGLVAERASGTPYRDLMKDGLWEPAGMSSTTFSPQEVIASGNYSYGHHYDPVGDHWYIFRPNDYDSWPMGPAGFAFSTVGDLARWALLLMDGGGPVLSSWSTTAMQRRQQWTHYTPDLYYGFGIMIEEYQGLDVRRHGGNIDGYSAYLLWVPERRFVVALLANVSWSLSDAAYCIVDEVLEPVPVQPPNLTTDPSTWVAYVGDYVITDSEGESMDATVYLDGNRLMTSIVDPEDPGNIITGQLYQAFLDTFVIDSDGDGTTETDLTFCGTRGRPEVVKWIRNRLAVGERARIPRRDATRRP